MNKNLTAMIVIIGVLIIAGAGFAIWSSINDGNIASQDQGTTPTTNTDNSKPAIQPTPPTVQTDAITVPYISTVVVKGTINPNGASTVYWYEYGQTSAFGAKTITYVIGSGRSTIYTPAYITGLLSNTTYYFRLIAKNTMGTVNGETFSFRTNSTPPPTGAAPTTNSTAATNIVKTSADLRGQVNPKGSETTFWFEYGLNADLGWVSALQSAGSENSSQPVSVLVSNLQPLTKYYFRLNAQNQFGTVNGQILNFTTQGPVEPSAPTASTDSATALNDSSARLNATVNPNGAATTYWFEYSNNSLLSNVVVKITQEQSLSSGAGSVNVSANVDNLNNNTKYYFRVVAKNQYGTVSGNMQSLTTKK